VPGLGVENVILSFVPSRIKYFVLVVPKPTPFTKVRPMPLTRPFTEVPEPT